MTKYFVIVVKNRSLSAIYVGSDNFCNQSAVSNVVIGHCPSREYLIQICGCNIYNYGSQTITTEKME